MFKQILFVVAFLSFFLLSSAQLQWPSVMQTTKPWTRWWWHGSVVTKSDLIWNLEQYQKAGLGGVEITPIYGVQGHEKMFINYLSPQWMEMVTYTLKEAKRLDLGVDVANATGWLFGGPWVTEQHASKTAYYNTYTVKAGEQLNMFIQYKQETLVRTANNKPVSIDTVKQPVWTNKNLQALALDQIIYPENPPLQLLMGYGDNGTVLNLTSKVESNGELNWTAPQDENFTLYALFIGLHGKMVERAAPGGEGYAIDHFSAEALDDYLKKFDEAFKGCDISYLRAFFNDSYEVDDAIGQADWTPHFFDKFEKRRGYDLKQHLPALFGKDSADKNARVRYDYRATIDELLLENFTQHWRAWAASKKAIVRNQSHGSPANILDLYSAVDIPETEGAHILRFKFAASAANVTGKQLTSAESATWLNEHFLSSWSDVKKAVDLYFLGGVNHIIYHGAAYSPKDVPWPGWLFYAAVHFQPTNPQWKDFGALNAYVTRVQSFLQNTKADNDVLFYYPLIDRYSQPGNTLLQHFDGMEKNFEGTDFEVLSKWILEKGCSFDFFSDRQLQKFKVADSLIETGGNRYKTILLPANKFITDESFKKLIALAKNGATILVYKNLPADVPGWNDLDKRRKALQDLLSQLVFIEKDKFKKAIVGKGMFLMGDDIETLMQTAGVRKEMMTEKRLQFIRKKNDDGNLYFINNRSEYTVADWISLNTDAVSVALFEPMFGKRGLAKWRKTGNGIEVLLQLQPYESIIVQAYAIQKSGDAFKYMKPIDSSKEIEGTWTIEFLNGGPLLPQKTTTNKLISWTELGGEDVKKFSGVAKYSIQFKKPETNLAPAGWLLGLGKVASTAEVFLNGKKLATLIGPNFQLTIPSSELKQTNMLEVIVANLMANRISYMDKNNLPWKIFYNINMAGLKRENVKNGLFNASSWKPLPSGLLGPVTLTPVAYEQNVINSNQR